MTSPSRQDSVMTDPALQHSHKHEIWEMTDRAELSHLHDVADSVENSREY